MKGLILTLGTGRDRNDIARALAEHTIPDHNPDRILVLATPESEAETLPLVQRFAPDYAGVMQCFTHDVNLNVDRLFETYVQVIRESLITEGLAPEQLVADFTSGTKNMSAALVLAAVDLRIRSFSYVNGRRDSTGRVIPGTETRQTIRPRSVHLSRLLADFERLFDRADFAAAQAVIASIRQEQLDAFDRERIDLLDRLASFYGAWDRYDLDGAVSIDKPAASADISPPLPGHVADAFYQQSRTAVGIISRKQFHPNRLADLIENAERRARGQAYNDAMLRLYRAIEYLAQLQLHEVHSIDTSNVDLKKVPESLHETFETLRSTSGVIAIPLTRSYQLLETLEDPLGNTFQGWYRNKKNDLQKLLNRRNNSILAHGFDTVSSSDYHTLLNDYVLPLARIVVPDLDEVRDYVRFPTFQDYPSG